MKKQSILLRSLVAMMLMGSPMMMTSCSNDDLIENPGNTVDPNKGRPENTEAIGGRHSEDVTLAAGQDYWLSENLIIEEGATLNVEAGVTVYVSPYTNPEIVIHGKMYAWGEEGNEILFTLSEAQPEFFDYGRVNWGGINGGEVPEGTTRPDQEIGLTYVTVQYAGGPMNENSEAVRVGKLEPGELGYSVFFNNNQGQLYMENCAVEHSGGDAIYVERGQIALFHNVVAYAGTTEDEAFNFKQGTIGDCAFNLMYSAATNGIKINNSKPVDGDTQTNVNMYNNTVAYCGWRRDGERGGSINIEKDAKGLIANNLIVNSKFGTKVDPSADVDFISLRNNYYFGEEVVVGADGHGNGFVPHHGILPFEVVDDEGNVIDDGTAFWNVFDGSCNAFDGDDFINPEDAQKPGFANFVDVPSNPDGTPGLELDYTEMDFALTTGSPAANFGTDDASLLSTQVVTSVGGVTVNRPALSKAVGAFGVK